MSIAAAGTTLPTTIAIFTPPAFLLPPGDASEKGELAVSLWKVLRVHDNDPGAKRHS